MNIPKVDDVKDLEDRSFDALHKYMLDNDIPEYLQIINRKYIRFSFDKMFGKKGLPTQITDISIGKKAFLNNIAIVLRYVNYFIKYFDDDHELMCAYFTTMFCIMREDLDFTVDDLVFTIRNYFASKTMVDKIARMVEYNIDENVMKKADKKYDESLQLTTDHLKCIMGISILHKIIIPVLSHYIKVRSDSIDIPERQLYFKCFTCFLDVFDERFDVAFYEKIYHTATTRVSKTNTDQKLMWARRKRIGITPTSYVNVLMSNLFIEISQKALFNKSAIVFIHVCFDTSTKNELRKQDKYDYTDMQMEVSDAVNEEVSKFDKMLISSSHISEKDMFRSEKIIEDTINRLAELNDIRFKDDELNFYMQSLNLDDAQFRLIFLYYAPMFGSYDVISSVKINDVIKMIIIMKKILKQNRYIYVPQIISGILDKNKAKRLNKKKIETFLMKHPGYEEIVKQYEFSDHYLNKDRLINDMKTLISCPITPIDYERQDLINQKIIINDVAAMDEIINIINNL